MDKDSGEKFTEGLDGLNKRLEEYKKLGAEFTKWRAIINIDLSKNYPSLYCLEANAFMLARYAKTVQDYEMVPIVEPEILMDGDHPIGKTAAIQEMVIKEVYSACIENGVYLEGTLLKPSMTVPGADCPEKSNPKEVAEYTIRTLERTVPSAVAGITFLSGGLSEEAASVYLNEMNKIERKAKWNVSFSYGRALQHSCLKAWGGTDIDAGQKALIARAQANSEAAKGQYVPGSQPSSDEALFIAGYTY